MEKNGDEILKLWQIYAKTKAAELKEQLILHYAYLVKYVAGRLSVHIGHHVEYEDITSYGIMGLIDAIDKFDYTKGVKFETYASLRIRGSIIDSLRELDWVPRTLRQKNKQVEQVYREMETTLGREPSMEELSEKLNMPYDEVIDLIKKSSIISLVSLDDYLEQNYETSFQLPFNTQEENPENQYEVKELRQILVDAIDKLTEKEKTVMSLYYFEEMMLKEISYIMGVSESRVSQIHSKAVFKLKTKLEKYKSLFFSM